MNRSALFIKTGKYLQRRRFADVIGVALVSHAERENLGAIDAFALRVQSVGDAPYDKGGHLAVDVSRQLNQPRLASFHARFPGQIIGIHGNAMTAESRTRVERHETERFGFGRFDDFPNINTKAVASERYFIGERDVHTAKSIF